MNNTSNIFNTGKIQKLVQNWEKLTKMWNFKPSQRIKIKVCKYSNF